MWDLETRCPSLKGSTVEKRDWVCASFGGKLERRDVGRDVDVTATAGDGMVEYRGVYVCQRLWNRNRRKRDGKRTKLKDHFLTKPRNFQDFLLEA